MSKALDPSVVTFAITESCVTVPFCTTVTCSCTFVVLSAFDLHHRLEYNLYQSQAVRL